MPPSSCAAGDRHIIPSNTENWAKIFERAKNLVDGVGLKLNKEIVVVDNYRYRLFHAIFSFICEGKLPHKFAHSAHGQLLVLQQIVSSLSGPSHVYGLADVFPIRHECIFSGCLYNIDRLLVVLTRFAQKLGYKVNNMPHSYFIDSRLARADKSPNYGFKDEVMAQMESRKQLPCNHCFEFHILWP